MIRPVKLGVDSCGADWPRDEWRIRERLPELPNIAAALQSPWHPGKTKKDIEEQNNAREGYKHSLKG